MWYFISPDVVFSEDAISHLDELAGRRALVVTDTNMVDMGFFEEVKEQTIILFESIFI